MPCNSDYMEPTRQEKERVSTKAAALKAISDKMVYDADVMREAILATGGKMDRLTLRQAVDLSELSSAAMPRMLEGDKLADEVKREYAYPYNGAPGKVTAYQRAKEDYAYVAGRIRMMLNGIDLDEEAMNAIENDQIEHRMEDVKRLIPIFTKKGDFKMVAKLANVDFTKALDPQIGFSPDDF